MELRQLRPDFPYDHTKNQNIEKLKRPENILINNLTLIKSNILGSVTVHRDISNLIYQKKPQ